MQIMLQLKRKEARSKKQKKVAEYGLQSSLLPLRVHRALRVCCETTRLAVDRVGLGDRRLRRSCSHGFEGDDRVPFQTAGHWGARWIGV